MDLQLRISGTHHQSLKEHLLPDDGLEAVAVALCGRYCAEELTIFTVHDVILIPYTECKREPNLITWSTSVIESYFERIGKSDLALMKIHSHPGGYRAFSETDDASDQEFFSSVFGWSVNDKPHLSTVMLPDGEIFGRAFFSDLSSLPIRKTAIVGDTVEIYSKKSNIEFLEFSKRNRQTFGDTTYSILNSLHIGVVGCSGTGSPVIEQLVRLGIGQITIIDPDSIEEKNVNRILNSTISDAKQNRSKVYVLKEAIERIGIGTKVNAIQANLYDNKSIAQALIQCDFIIGCMDSVDGRYLLNQLSTFYILPYLDLGVKLEADGVGGINKICGSVHYLQPGKSSLITRGVYTMEDMRAASQYRQNPAEFENLKKNSYIKNINVNAPAVISVNMSIASIAINEFLNRIHEYKAGRPEEYAQTTIDITENFIVNVSEDDFMPDLYLKKKIGRGDIAPFIEMPELS
jgi:hypothetical protein